MTDDMGSLSGIIDVKLRKNRKTTGPSNSDNMSITDDVPGQWTSPVLGLTVVTKALQ